VSRIASFHLVKERPGRQPLVLARLATDRFRLGDVDGLLFWRLLGTGRGDDSAAGADLSRSALFAIWRDEQALEQFLASHPIAHRWANAHEVWHVRLRGAGGHGSWNGFPVADQLADQFTDGRPEGRSDERHDGAVAIITRARVRPRAWRRFTRATADVNAAIQQADGLLAVVGIGEAPVGRLGTFSLWETLDAARSFAEQDARHRSTASATRAGEWFSEELFMRFDPISSSGTWSGRDPLVGNQPL